jgi:hypothetical protein
MNTNSVSSNLRLQLLAHFVAAVALAQPALTPQLVERIRSKGAELVEFQGLRFESSAVEHAGNGLGLAYGNSAPVYRISGISLSKNSENIPLSDIELITFLGVEGNLLRLRITHYSVSPAELLEKQLNWSQLRNRIRAAELRVPRINPAGEALYWVGRASEYDDPQQLGRVEKTSLGRAIRVTLPITATWWAVPSVANDPNCPCKGLAPLGNTTKIADPEKRK